jgi:CelD/BcsL family acetyltransferase involved in cellulose biosynthesis
MLHCEVSSHMVMSTISAVPRWNIADLSEDWGDFQPAWDDYVRTHPKGTIFHTSNMISVFQAAKSHEPLALAAVDADGEIMALLVAVRVQTLPDPLGRVSSRSIFYAEPLCDDDPHSIDALTALIAHHDRLMRHSTLFTEIRPLLAPGPERIALERCGYQYMDYLNFIVDVSRPADVLWRRLLRDARRGVRQFERSGFQTRPVETPRGVDQLYQCLLASYGNANVPLAHQSLFDAAFAILHPSGEIRIEAVMKDDVPIAMLATLNYRKTAFAWYCGTQRMRGFSPLDSLFWRELLWSHEHGFTTFDMGGAGWPGEPYGVRRYKAKFGGALVHYGRYRKVYSPWRMALAERAYQFGRKFISPR